MNPKQKLILLIKQARLAKIAGVGRSPAVKNFAAPPIKPPNNPKPVSGVIPAPLAPNVGKGPGAVRLPVVPPRQPNAGPGFQLLNNPVPPKAPATAPAPPPPKPAPAAGPGSFDLMSMFSPIQQKIEELGVEGAAPYMGLLHPIFNAVGGIAGPAGTAGLTDFLFHGGKNIATLTSGLSSRFGNMSKDTAAQKDNVQPAIK